MLITDCYLQELPRKMIPALVSSITYASFILIILLLLITTYMTRNFDYWKKNGIPYEKPYPLVGNFLKAVTLSKSMGIILKDLYNKHKSPFFGIFIFDQPHLVVRDPEIIKAVLVKDFNYFNDRAVLSDESCDSVSSKMLFFLKNPQWKMVRTKITPVFSSGKIKSMLGLINAAGDSLKNYINENMRKDSIECKELCAKFSTDVITSCAFGLEAGSFKNENADFRIVGRQMFDFKLLCGIRQSCYFLAPTFAKLMQMPFFDLNLTAFLSDVFWKAIDERKYSKRRNDLIDLIIDLTEKNDGNSNSKLDNNTIVAQASQFFAAGFETISTTISYTLYELCMNPEIQSKLKSEIAETFGKDGEVTYTAVQNMKYLRMVICETLRKYPVLPFLDRICARDYKLPNSNFVIKKGTSVFISILGLQMDPTYFVNPEIYDPERFSDENKSYPHFTYIPFGDGPRNCIGERFGLLTTKIGIIQILSEFDIQKCADTPKTIEFSTKTVLLGSNVGLPLRFVKSKIESL